MSDTIHVKLASERSEVSLGWYDRLPETQQRQRLFHFAGCQHITMLVGEHVVELIPTLYTKFDSDSCQYYSAT